MPCVLKYLRETGAIVGVWESTQLDLVAAQRAQDDAVHGYLLHLEPLALRPVEEQYHVVHGLLVVKEARSS